MNKYKGIALLILTLLLAACTNNSEQVSPSGTQAAKVQSATVSAAENTSKPDGNKGKPLEQLIPAQWKSMDDHESTMARADLDGDGIEDIAIALEAVQHEPEEAPKRALLLALGTGDNRYSEPAMNEVIIYRADEGGVFGDPFLGLRIEENTVIIEHYGGSNWRWSNSYQIGWQIDGWYAVGYTSSSEFLNSPYYEEYHYDIVTGEIVLDMPLENGESKQEVKYVDPAQFVKFVDLKPDSFQFIHEASQLYESYSLGFSIEFPASWSNYVHVEEDDGALHVYFTGESEISHAEAFGGQGLYLFTIASEDHLTAYIDMPDNMKKLGKANGSTYHYFTATDCSVCMLYYTDDLDSDDGELLLRQSDSARYELMDEDLEQLINSFTPLE